MQYLGDIMYVIDMHCDSLSEVSSERGLVTPYNFSKKFPQLQFFAHFSKKGNDAPDKRRKRLMQAVNVYLSECERLGFCRVTSGRDIFSVTDNSLPAAMLTLEGGGGLFADSPELDTLVKAGLSVLGMAWDTSELSACAWDEVDTGLTIEGKRMVNRCTELGIILDVSHLSDRAFYETFELSPMPHIATHSNFREVCQSKRNLTRDMAKMIASRGGVIGINLYPPFLRDGGASAEDIIRHIDYALELLGDRNIGFGFDIDGTDGLFPCGINPKISIHDQVIDLLLSRYSLETVERIAGLNVIEFLKDNLM